MVGFSWDLHVHQHKNLMPKNRDADVEMKLWTQGQKEGGTNWEL